MRSIPQVECGCLGGPTLGQRAIRPRPSMKELTMADKSPKKSTTKTAASKTLKEKRADKQVKAASKRKD